MNKRSTKLTSTTITLPNWYKTPNFKSPLSTRYDAFKVNLSISSVINHTPFSDRLKKENTNQRKSKMFLSNSNTEKNVFIDSPFKIKRNQINKGNIHKKNQICNIWNITTSCNEESADNDTKNAIEKWNNIPSLQYFEKPKVKESSIWFNEKNNNTINENIKKVVEGKYITNELIKSKLHIKKDNNFIQTQIKYKILKRVRIPFKNNIDKNKCQIFLKDFNSINTVNIA